MASRYIWLLITLPALLVGSRTVTAQSSLQQTNDVGEVDRHANATGSRNSFETLSSARFGFGDPGTNEGPSSATSKPGDTPRKSLDDWEFTLAPYLWMTSLRADVDVGPVSATADACFSDLLEHMDMGAQLRFEGRRGHWGFYLDGTYMSLGGDARARIGPFRVRGLDVDGEFTQAWLDFGGMYRFGERGRSFDIMLGGRYTYIGADISIGPFLDVDESDDFVSPVVGGRWEYALSDKWALSLAGDVGGFGVGDAADLTFGVTGLLGYRVSDHSTLVVGYRYYNSDYSTSDLDLDIQLHGPVVGMAFQF